MSSTSCGVRKFKISIISFHSNNFVSRIPLGILSSLLLCALWVSPFIEQPSIKGDPLGVLVFGAAALIELMAEPLWVLGQLHQYVSLKVS